MESDSTQQPISAITTEAASSSTPAEDTHSHHRSATPGTDAPQAGDSSAGELGNNAASPLSPENVQGSKKRRRRLCTKVQEIKRRARRKFSRQEPGERAEDENECTTILVQSEQVREPESASINSAPGTGSEMEMPRAAISPAPEIGGKTDSDWAAVARSIRDIDEQKIKGYTDDIDNILVFAGLYSAVLTALLVESYLGLQPDPSSIMITLLGQLVTQTHTYTFTNGYLNSTIPPLDVAAVPLQFQPSLAAKRVNVLWFASLTLSLMSASFGILVKQWLREYLSGESVSPQAQLRIRHFRTPGLDHWRVFTIAALLPLLLQLALALFFIGLCFFTLDIHQSIGYTTIPLVAGWAFLFLAASLGPAVSPRCPYKIPMFKYVMTLLRASLFHVARLWNGMPALPPKSEWPVKPDWTWWSLGYNEADALKDGRNDVDILVDVDASQTDDQLLMKMCNALKEKHTEPALIVNFVLRIIATRLQIEVQTRPIPLMLDLSQLPVQTCTILMDAVADVLGRELRKFSDLVAIEWSGVAQDCLFLLSARHPCLLSAKAMEAVSLCFTGTQDSRIEGTFALIFTDVSPKDLHPEDVQNRQTLGLHLLERFHNAFLRLNAWQLHYTISVIAKRCCCICNDCKTFADVMKNHKTVRPSLLGQCMCDVLTGYLLHQVKHDKEWNEWHRDIFLGLLAQWQYSNLVLYSLLLQREDAEKPWHRALEELVRHLVTKDKYALYFYRLLFHRIEYNHTAPEIFNDALFSSNDLEQALTNLHSAFKRYIDDMVKRPELLDEHFYKMLMYFVFDQALYMSSVVQKRKRAVVEEVYLSLWQKTWKSMHTAMCNIELSTRTEQLTVWAGNCLQRIDNLDNLWLPASKTDVDKDFDVWVQDFNPAGSFFDDEMIQFLMKFFPPAEHGDYRRVRRIQRKRELEEEKRVVDQGNNDSDVNDNSSDYCGADSAAADEADHTETALDDKGATLGLTHGHSSSIVARQADKRLVMKMCHALKSMNTEPEVTIHFVLKITGFHLRTEFKRPLPRILDFSLLPQQACSILMSTVADIFTREVNKLSKSEPIEWTGLIGDCLSLLVARIPCPLPAKAMAAISPWLLPEESDIGMKLKFTTTQPEEQQDLCQHLQHWLRNAFPQLDIVKFLNAVHTITKELGCMCGDCTDIGVILREHSDTISLALKQHTCDVLASYMLHQVQIGIQYNTCHHKILSILFSQWMAGAEGTPWHGALEKLVAHMLIDPDLASQFYPFLFDKYFYVDSAAPVFMCAFISSKKKQQILVNMYNVFSDYVVEDDWTRNDSYFLNLFWYVDGQMAPMTYVVKNEEATVVEVLYLPIWQLIWKTMHNAMIGTNRLRRNKKLTKCASQCLEKIDMLDNLWLAPIASEPRANASEEFDDWAKAFDPEKSFFGDDLIQDLMKFLPRHSFAGFKRVRRILRIRALEGIQDEQSPEEADEDDDTRTDGGSEANDDDVSDNNSEGGDGRAGEDDKNTKPVAASTAQPIIGSPDNGLTLSTAPPPITEELHANGVTIDNSLADLPTPAIDAQPGQPVEITRADTPGGGDAEHALASDTHCLRLQSFVVQ